MWWSLLLLLGGATIVAALNLDYLDPVKLQTVTPSQVQKRAAEDIIHRYLKQVAVEIDILWFKDHKDTFHLKTHGGSLNIRASSGVAAVWGFNYYLKKHCKSQIEWQTKNVNIPDPLPEVDETVVANDRFRYYQNVCTASYSFVWWGIHEWRKHLEWMALNGINLVLAPVAQEAAWTRVYRQMGMTQEDIDKHFTGPAFLSWLRMGNVHGWGGPLPKSWHNIQTFIQNDITNTMINLGMVPVLPAFNGHVPVAFSRLYPNVTFHEVEQWNKFGNAYCCGLFLDPFDPMFKRIGTKFLKEITNGSLTMSHIYTADPFNEVKLSEFSTPLVQETEQKIFSTLLEFDKDAVWLLQNWMFVDAPLLWPVNRVKAFINSVPNGRMLILDLQSEQWPQYDLYQMYFGQPFIWCMLHNFGGTLGMFGNMVTINKDVYEVRSRANSTMIGTGLTPEGINQNYVVYDLMLESAWRKSPVEDLDNWAADYAERRYGCNATAGAWKYLLKSVYSFNGLNRVRGKYVTTRRPSFKIKPWAWYNSYDLFEAFRRLVFDTKSCDTEGFQYDLVDVTRQALQYRAEQLYVNVANDRFSNTFVFEESINRFLDALNDISVILSQNKYFSAADWFMKARKLGNNSDEADLYEMNARNQITLWGPSGEISDYACKQWAEVFTEYYYPRWNVFLSAALKAKQAEESFSEKDTRRIIAATVEVPFVVKTQSYQTSSSGSWSSTLVFAKRLYKKWVYAPDVVDLPVIVIKADNDIKMTVVDVQSESVESPEPPSVIILPTTPLD